ncbi:MAG: OmpP1/FadL family transporter [Planctomycetota bacterium]|jgi:long-chain fatty acid transport protein
MKKLIGNLMLVRWILVCGLFLFLADSSLLAGGLYVNEFGTPSMGNAGAGSNAEASDASTAFHNAAGMTRLDRPQFMLGGGVIYSEIRFDSDGTTGISGGDGGNAGGWFPFGSSHYVHPINENLRFGLSMIALSGSVLDYDSDWTGRYQNQKVELFTLTTIPTLGYRINDWLSVGGGPAIVYGTLDMDIAGPPPIGTGQASLDGDDVDVGYTLSTLFKLSERTRLGVFYLSETELDFSGDLKIKPLGLSIGSDTTIPFAQMIRGSIYHDLNDKWALVSTIGWEDWSTMDNITLSTGGGGGQLPRRWSDTWHYSGGVHYRPNDKWLLRSGIAYDTNPVDATDRTADMPIDRQVRYAVGADYKWSETLTVGAAFVYADMGSAKINSSTLSGKYDDFDIYMLGVYANWKF